MRVVPVPCLSDNYAYLVAADGSKEAFVVDPSEAAPVIAALEREGLRLTAIVNTHHHHDHVGGNEGLLERFGKLPVYAYESDEGRVPAQTVRVKDGESFKAAGLELKALHVPGHTLGAVSYVVEDAVFTGDTLFVAGCGRLFEGTPEQMNRSLNETLGLLPKNTKVYCGHEYTASNLKFAIHAEPTNEKAKAKLEKAKATREKGEPTVPSTIGEELETNPFMRVTAPEIVKAYPGSTPAEVLGAVRKAKDAFK